MIEILPGMFWLGTNMMHVSLDVIRSHDIKVVISDQQSASIPGMIVMHAHPESFTKIDELCNAAMKAYRKDIGVGIVMSKFETPATIIAWLMLKLTRMADVDDINELLHVNYQLQLNEQQTAILKRHSMCVG